MKQSLAGVSPAAVPGSLLSQYKLLRAVIDAPWATRLDHKITSHIIDRYFGKYGVARASLRYLQLATGATRTNIIESVRRITDKGAISIMRQGIGTRPTEYALNFDFATKAARGPVDNTATSGPVDDTSCGPGGDTASVPSGPVDSTESYLLNGLTSPLKVSRNEDTHAAASPPPVSGVNADTAGTARDPAGFEELWAAYPRKHHRSRAQDAYKALAPSPALHATLVTQAAAWASHYQQTATDKKWWKHLHKWLAEERYLEDLPEPYENPKEAAIARAKTNGPRKADKSKEPGKSGLSPKTPIGRHTANVVSTEVTGGGFSEEVTFQFNFRIEDGDHKGKEFSHAFKFVSADEEEQGAGQATFAELRRSTGLLEPKDTSDFHGKTLLATVKAMGRIEYAGL